MPVVTYSPQISNITYSGGLPLDGQGRIVLPNSSISVGASGTDPGQVGISFVNEVRDALEALRLQLRQMGIIQ